MFLTIMARNVGSRFSGKNLDHSKITKNMLFFREKKFSKLHKIFSGQTETRFRKNILRTITGQNFMKNVTAVEFWEFFSCDAYTRLGLFEWSVWFSVIFLSLDERIDLKMHILIELNGVHDVTCVPIILDHSIIRKNTFLNDPNSWKGGFGSFSWVT